MTGPHHGNVVVTVREDGYGRAWQFLKQFGRVGRTPFFNVLVLDTDDLDAFLETLAARVRDDPDILEFLSKVEPLQHTFSFRDAEEFADEVQQLVLAWTPRLGGKSFHVRMHRRGLKGRLSTPAEERRLADAVLRVLEDRGTPARVTFDDPDAIIALETVGNHGGVSLWERDDLRQYPFLRLD